MTEQEFFLELFPQEFDLLDIEDFVSFDGGKHNFVNDIEELNIPRKESEGPVCECVGENTNKALFEYFIRLINDGIELPIYLNNKNEVMDGWHRFHAYYYSGMTMIPFYRNKLIRNHGFCWKKGLEGRRRLRTKTW